MMWRTVTTILICWIAAPDAIAAKLVYYGWGNPDASYVVANAAAMEAMPFDGTAIVVPIDSRGWAGGRRDTSNQLGWAVFGPRRLDMASFADTIAALGRVRWHRFTENFLPAVINTATQSQRFSWFDDERWDTIVANWALLLKIARRAHCRGIVFDPEDYGGGLFEHPVMASRHAATFDEYRTKVRERGRQLMQRGRRVFPGMVVLGLFGPSLPLDVENEADLAGHRYGLLAAFVDGLIDGADDRFVFVDGGEYAYGLRYPQQFASLRDTMARQFAARIVLPGDRRQCLRIGFGLWIDNGGRRRWFAEQPWRNYFSPSGFEGALKAALLATDEYVWVYSQEARFFPPRALPDAYLDAIRRAAEGPHGRSSSPL